MSVAKRDYYEVLSVGRDCDDQTLKGAYRKLALQFHPDRNPGDHVAEEKFKKRPKPMRFLAIRKSAPPTTVTAIKGSAVRKLPVSTT